jgi:hypothetical protein
MTAAVPPGPAAGATTPAEREARWLLHVQFAIEAASEDEARAILGQALAGLVPGYVPPGMKPGLPLRGEPVIRPRHRRIADNIWIAKLHPDLTHLQVIDPDTASSRCSFVQDCFPLHTTWMAPLHGERKAKLEWPPEIWVREPGRDDVLLHPAVRAVMIYCEPRLD